MIARFPGRCLACKGDIVPGQSIHPSAKGQRTYEHDDCSNVNVDTPPQPKVYKNPDESASVPQRNLIRKLSFERLIPDHITIPATPLAPLTVSQAGEIIDALFASPVATKQTIPGPEELPAGRYAVVLDLNGVEHDFFVRVWRGSQNPNVVNCYNDDTGDTVNKHDAIKRILDAGVIESARRYGRLRKKCFRCNNKLRNRLSLELDIGPECLKHLHSPERAKEIRAAARQVIRDRGEDPSESVEGFVEPEQLALEAS